MVCPLKVVEKICSANDQSRDNLRLHEIRQPGDLGVLREVVSGFSEEVKTRGFPSPSLGGFGFVVIGCASFIRRVA